MTESEHVADSANLEPEAKTLDLGRCFQEAMDFFKPNILTLTIAALATTVVSAFTLLILAGPMIGGWVKMITNAWDREDRKAQLGDVFGAFDRLPGLIGLFFLCFLLTLVGFILLIIPVFIVAACLTFSFYLFMNHGHGAIDAIKASFRIVFPRHLLWLLILMVIMGGIQFVVGIVPIAGIILGWVAQGFCWGLSYSAYVQLVRETGAGGPLTSSAAPSAGEGEAPAT